MRIRVLAASCALACSIVTAQSPADGHIQNHSYVNKYLHFAYTWPSILQPQDPASLRVHPDPTPNEALLFVARQGTEPFGIVVICEKLNTPLGPHSLVFKDGPDFLRRVPYGFPPEAHFKILSNKHITSPGGFPVDELDYSAYGEYDSGIAVRTGDFILVFKCNAKSLADLATMTNSVLATRSDK